MPSQFKHCSCCRRACPREAAFCPSCTGAGCQRAAYGTFKRGPTCPVKTRARNGQAAAARARKKGATS
jgi:hypothetical protein